ncbi:MAG: hypothetical protein ABIO70_22450, partial [Pseudomonadota bacterium]
MIGAEELARLAVPGADLAAAFAAMRAAWGLDLLVGEGSPPAPWCPIRARPPRAWGGEDAGPLPLVPGSAAALTAAFAVGRTTPEDALEVLLARIAAGDFGLAAWSPFSGLDPLRAVADARASAVRWRRGLA